MSDDTQLVGERDRQFKSPHDGRILPVNGRVYKLKDRGEGQCRIVVTAPIEALNELDAAISFLERAMVDEIPALNVLRVSIQMAKERCVRHPKRLKVETSVSEGQVALRLAENPTDDREAIPDRSSVQNEEGEGEAEMVSVSAYDEPAIEQAVQRVNQAASRVSLENHIEQVRRNLSRDDHPF